MIYDESIRFCVVVVVFTFLFFYFINLFYFAFLDVFTLSMQTTVHYNKKSPLL